ncbi:MAG: (2Fe-2S)-binding protein [Gammaproteobacteria bacterium]|nr:(2Fe-2S)-binding protein [Gammaproteobacteria bacterium]MYF02779.1 (2Fe-2S)-binding protein [Gammaproteobacteria bacterium]MYI77157.1 (2Fe-2S)-binding protein [Gammaproteobacteria bacterium]
MVDITITVNGVDHSLSVPDNTLLSDLLRENLRLTGTHIGCDTSQCGSCTVELNGRAVKSCTLLAAQANNGSVTTIEGLGTPVDLHPMQAAFRDNHALQCGFCTPGMIMTAIEMINDSTEPLTADQIREGLEGNFCRCTGYQNIVKAVLAAQTQLRSA